MDAHPYGITGPLGEGGCQSIIIDLNRAPPNAVIVFPDHEGDVLIVHGGQYSIHPEPLFIEGVSTQHDITVAAVVVVGDNYVPGRGPERVQFCGEGTCKADIR